MGWKYETQNQKRLALKLAGSSATVALAIMLDWKQLTKGEDLDCYDTQSFDWLASKEVEHDKLRTLDESAVQALRDITEAEETLR